MNIHVKKAAMRDLETVVKLAMELWPHHLAEELAEEFSAILVRENAAVFLAYEGGAAVGFAQCQLRHDYVEGTSSSPVGYLEGIYVRASDRHLGFAGQLMRACEDWARGQHCTEFASDCQIDHTESLSFHLKMGFKEANRIICFAKHL